MNLNISNESYYLVKCSPRYDNNACLSATIRESLFLIYFSHTILIIRLISGSKLVFQFLSQLCRYHFSSSVLYPYSHTKFVKHSTIKWTYNSIKCYYLRASHFDNLVFYVLLYNFFITNL